MNILEIIAKKRDGLKLNKEEIEFFVNGYTEGKITDYQAAALVMAIYIRGMDDEEITNLTISMAYSGEVLDLSELGMVIDKHSTGGVGDKITLILMPIVASLGLPVAKMSGRGLGFTGGTIDKLESIPGYSTNIDDQTFRNNVKNIGISLIGQTKNIAPADKKLYALRDTISCTDSIPLIASSIMSKKIAAGANKIVLDVTCGSGAFMKNRDDAKKLADIMTRIGNLAGKETVCVITDMNQPVGNAVGNILEVVEAIKVLKNEIMPEDIKEIITKLGGQMLFLARKCENVQAGEKMILANIENGAAFNKFKELVLAQGGDISYLENPDKFEKAKYIEPIIATQDGTISKLDALQVGQLSCFLGAGRETKEQDINPRVGFTFNKKVGDEVHTGDILGFVHSDDENKLREVLSKNIFEF